MQNFEFNKSKSISALLYICYKLIDFDDPRADTGYHKIFKILYFADKKHIAQYGRPVIDDTYIAMEYGPVPSETYYAVKNPGGHFEIVNNYIIVPKSEPDIDEFSKTDLSCLNESIEENKFLSFTELADKSHDSAYNRTKPNDKIQYDDILIASNASPEMISYIKQGLNADLVLRKCLLP